ncbi:hypothetical protein P692DRAFT_201803456 [Suillus brevipes Sb2]|nr:hypothetical protein P692DRAFT_201803456 [Suillus brevipes Sb2]
MVASLFLWLLHLLHISLVFLTTKFQQRRYLPPQPVTACRSKLPKHLAIVLVSSDAANPKHTEGLYLECLARVVKWCKALGIEQLTAYDAEGTLLGCSDIIQERLAQPDDLHTDESESELEYPLTPPLSEASESRSHSPDFEDSPVQLNVTTAKRSCSSPTSAPASKAAIASAARFLLNEEFRRRQKSYDVDHVGGYELPIPELNSILEGSRTIAHDAASLQRPSIITENAFCRALDEYAGAQFRLGR